MSDPVQFPRKPYRVWYKDQTGEIQKITRRPPEKLHPFLPQDLVILNNTKSDAFIEGKEYGIKNISWKSPNVLQLEQENGDTTFVNYSEVSLQEKASHYQNNGNGNNVNTEDDPISSRYLGWP